MLCTRASDAVSASARHSLLEISVTPTRTWAVTDDLDLLGQRLGRYTLVRRLGKGGMGEVFLAKSSGAKGFEKLVAIKRILPQFSANQQVVNMLVDEARISVRLNHPNIVQVLELDVDDGDGSHFIVMEYVEGHALSRLLRRIRKAGSVIDPLVACVVTIAVLDGLQAAHDQTDDDGRPARIIHRDISPQNVLLSMSGQVKIIDFGIARARDRLESTQGSEVKGKLRYMAPEQIKPTLAGAAGIDHRVDLFAAGTMLWEMLAMRARYPQTTDIEIIDAILDEPTPDLAAEGLIDAALMTIVAQATQRERRKRFSDAASFAAALRGYVYALAPALGPGAIAQLMRQHFGDAEGGREQKARAREPREGAASSSSKAPGAVHDQKRGASPPWEHNAPNDKTPAHPTSFSPRPEQTDEQDAAASFSRERAEEDEVTRTQFRPVIRPLPAPPPASVGPSRGVRRRHSAAAAAGIVLGLLLLGGALAAVRVAMRPHALPIASASAATSTTLDATSSPAPTNAEVRPPAVPAVALGATGLSVPARPADDDDELTVTVEVEPPDARITLAYRPEPRYVSPARFSARAGDVFDLLFEAEGYEPERRSILVDASALSVHVALRPIPMPLLVRVVPRDAEVTVNGEPLRAGLMVKPGEDLVIVASHPFFATKTLTLHATPGQALTADLTLDERAKAELVDERPPPVDDVVPSSRGRLLLSSRPTTAVFFVDGKKVGETSPVQLEVAPGTHKVTVRTKDAEQTFSLSVAGGGRVTREVVLE
jgi:serine/threonine protein kinase